VQKDAIRLTNLVCTILSLTLLVPALGAAAESPQSTNATKAGSTNSSAALSPDEQAEQAWKETEKALRPPMRSAQLKRPTAEERAVIAAENARYAGAAMAKARDFYSRFPNHPKAAVAREKERAIRLEILTYSAGRLVNEPNPAGPEAAMAELERTGRELMKDYPEAPTGYQCLMILSDRSTTEKATELLNEIANGNGPAELKATARGRLKRMDILGKPMEIAFTAVDGRDVDLKKMRGKVVVLDFWGTWCMPCVMSMPHLKEVYDKYHPQGLDLIGIAFDTDKDKLVSFLEEHEIKWAQHFDGKGQQNEFGLEFGIDRWPTVWIVGKDGKLRDMNGREDLEQKVEKLLAE
jgi:thiol-disulfide isomerase/thioredoxin